MAKQFFWHVPIEMDVVTLDKWNTHAHTHRDGVMKPIFGTIPYYTDSSTNQ